MSLRLDWCSHDAAKFAVEQWHYSKRMPHSKLVKIGVWEDDTFIGAIVFGLGATPQLCKPYGLRIQETCELVRVALDRHRTPVTRIVSIALLMLRRHCPGLRLCISFADPKQGHVGKIYQAGNWIYSGLSAVATLYWYNGRWAHGRAVSLAVKQKGVSRSVLCPQRRSVPGKHRYLMPLDPQMRRELQKFRKKYPKGAGSIENDAPVIQAGQGGVIPTPALHPKEIE